jgi:hypothetical protein
VNRVGAVASQHKKSTTGSLGRHRGLRLRTWAVIGIVWALFSPQLGAALLPADTLRDALSGLFDEEPSVSERTVDEFVNAARTATTWARPPTVHASSVRYFKEHFRDFDPNVAHAFPGLASLMPVSVGDLAIAAPLFAGQPILVSGNVYGDPTVVGQGENRTLSWAVAIRDGNGTRAVALVRVPVAGRMSIRSGDRVSVSGLVLADGAASRVDGRGLVRIVYLAGSAISRSMNITLIGGRRGGVGPSG